MVTTFYDAWDQVHQALVAAADDERLGIPADRVVKGDYQEASIAPPMIIVHCAPGDEVFLSDPNPHAVTVEIFCVTKPIEAGAEGIAKAISEAVGMAILVRHVIRTDLPGIRMPQGGGASTIKLDTVEAGVIATSVAGLTAFAP